MPESIMSRIDRLSKEREELLQRESHHSASPVDTRRLERIDHDLRVLWDLRRRELAGEDVDVSEDYLDDYDRYGGRESSGR
ncbi:DUF2630 family protein [Rubrobacter radiotolerans]|uniref:DUF2630 family protein n=1 Tax=Rubrobacter radiotolerans TaxID=42256 RepID=A0AB35T309_RUBRA|nr:DUF2630 family protein [Rubrobacter radiotolerans]MDX5893947.1 DUF2630 family protein [Rubrobacter radiotolerans]